jgi:DNA replication protein DnaC
MQVCEKHGCDITPIITGSKLYPVTVPKPCQECAKEYKAEYEKKKLEAEEKRQAERIKKIMAGDFMGIPKRFRLAEIHDFNVSQNYSIDESVLITGECGTGKTHLAVALAKVAYLDHENLNGRFMNFQELAINIKSSFRDESESMRSVIHPCLEGFRIFDDIGTGKPTDTAVEALYTIVNKRYEEVLPTIYTTNLSLGEISKVYGDRIASRLSACRVITLTGKDRRLQRAA